MLCLILCSSSFLFAQIKSGAKPLIIRGKLTNCLEKHLPIHFENEHGQVLTDTIRIDSNGNFNLKTFKINRPQRTAIEQNNILISNLFVAPGYSLTITGDGESFRTLSRTKKITGIGSESNRYYLLLDSILNAKNDTTNWLRLNEHDLLAYMKKNKQLKDSIFNIVFNKRVTQDKYLNYFGRIIQLNNLSNDLFTLLDHINRNKYGAEESSILIKSNFYKTVLDDLSRNESFISCSSRSELVYIVYLNYLVNLDYLKDSTLKAQKWYKFKKAEQVFRGKVKEFVLYKLMASYVDYCQSLDKLNEYKVQFEPYISGLMYLPYKESIISKISVRQTNLLTTQIGKSAPKFTLESDLGRTYNLEEFKGKVVYLDLWASWCAPCRSETPSLKILYNKYKNDSRIVFISVAVSDGITEWKRALREDKPDWIQLLDKAGAVSKSYVVNQIPQFVLIDKRGNIVSFDAPRPSNSEKLEKLLNQELAK